MDSQSRFIIRDDGTESSYMHHHLHIIIYTSSSTHHHLHIIIYTSCLEFVVCFDSGYIICYYLSTNNYNEKTFIRVFREISRRIVPYFLCSTCGVMYRFKSSTTHYCVTRLLLRRKLLPTLSQLCVYWLITNCYVQKQKKFAINSLV